MPHLIQLKLLYHWQGRGETTRIERLEVNLLGAAVNGWFHNDVGAPFSAAML